TILSRCQIFDFNRIRVEDAVKYLKQIAGKESLEYEEEALHVIAQKADGAMRDALSIFDQVVSFSGAKITYQDVIKNLNILDYEYFFRLTHAVLENDTASSLVLFNEVLVKGFDSRNFINGYAAHLRDLMVCKDPETIQLMEVGAGIKEKYLAQSKDVSLQFLYAGLEICNQADIQFRTSRNQRLTIELALVKLSNLTEVQKKKLAVDQGDPTTTDRPAVEKKPSLETESTEEAKPLEQNNGASRIVRKPSISIKDTLKGEVERTPSDEKSGPAEEEAIKGAEPKPEEVDPDRIVQAWRDYAASIEKSKPRVYSTLNTNRPVVKPDGTIRVLLNSEAQRDNFMKNIRTGLAGYIQEAAGIEKVEIIAGVTETEKNGKKIYTEQDKLDFLMKKNPELGALKSKFNLDFDV
ncbi:MAG: hypothetical protein KAT15_06600, partial [Bacteroidales bacterium]|nr:hypothetical protein [Bacteroidales bacterium]